MPNRNDYPSSVAELLDDRMKFKPAALRAVKALARSRPWRSNIEDRKEKFRSLNRALAAAYELPEPQLVFGKLNGGDSGRSCYIPPMNVIIISGTLSVVTFLHEWGHVRGMNERKACRWSVNLFRRVFPKSWARVTCDGHMVRQARSPDAS